MESTFSMILRETVIVAFFCSYVTVYLILCFPVFQNCAQMTKKVQSEQKKTKQEIQQHLY